MTYLAQNLAAKRTGDGKLCYFLREDQLGHLVREMDLAVEQLALVDDAPNHDDILGPHVLEKLASWRMNHSANAIATAVHHLDHSLHELQQAHRAVAGLFKGPMRDETEEALTRAIQGAKARLASMKNVQSGYDGPKRPHEVRRNTLSYLLKKSLEVAHWYQQLVDIGGISPDLLVELQDCLLVLDGMSVRLRRLRERSSQKMAQNLSECLEQLKMVRNRLNIIERHAGSRSGCWFGDYLHRPLSPFGTSYAAA